jgi:hypothetical protein
MAQNFNYANAFNPNGQQQQQQTFVNDQNFPSLGGQGVPQQQQQVGYTPSFNYQQTPAQWGQPVVQA